MPRSVETLMGVGEFTVAFVWDPDLNARLSDGAHLRWSNGDIPFATTVIGRRSGSERLGHSRTVGRSIEAELGVDDRGPIIEDLELLAGNNKLTNPGFELGDVFWETDEDPAWIIRDDGPAGEVRTGDWAAAVNVESGDPDVLRYDERWEANRGEQYAWTIHARRDGGTIGRIHARLIFEGRFRNGNKLTNGDFEDSGTGWIAPSGFEAVTDGANAYDGTGVIRILPNGQAQLVSNGDFEAAGAWSNNGTVATWSIVNGDAPNAHDGTGYATTTPPGAGQVAEYITGSYVDAAGRFKVQTWIRSDGTVADGHANVRVIVGNDTTTEEVVTFQVQPTGNNWTLVDQEVTIPDGYDRAWVALDVADTTAGNWYADTVKLWLVEGNTATLTADAVAVQEGRTLRFKGAVRNGPATTSGRVHAKLILAGSYRPTIEVQLGTIELTRDAWRFFDSTAQVPSGYDTAQVVITSEDLNGDYSWFDAADLRDTDTTTRIIEANTGQSTMGGGGPIWQELVATGIAPRGTESVHVEILAESFANGWQIDDCELIRVGTPATVAGALDQLLRDQDTDDYILNPGVVDGADTILFDTRIRMETNQAAIELLARHLAPTKLEWRTNPDATFDLGPAEDIYTDRPGCILTADMVILEDPPDIEQSTENQVERVTVIGDLRETPTGRKYLIVGEAQNDIPTATGILGGPYNRRRVIEEAGAYHPNLAAQIARVEADQANAPADQITLTIKDPTPWWGPKSFDVGDWIYPYLPDAGIEDTTNEQHDDTGKTIWPKQERVIRRTTDWAAGDLRIELFTDQGWEDITDSIDPSDWNDTTSMDLDLGSLPPDPATDPRSGEGENLQFLKYRTRSAKPRQT